MNRYKSLICLLFAVLLSCAFASGSAYGQEKASGLDSASEAGGVSKTPMPMEDRETGVQAFSELAGSAGVMTGVMNLAGSSDLDVVRCTLRSNTGNSGGDRANAFEVVLHGRGIESFRAFFAKLQEKWTPLIRKLGIRSRGPTSEKPVEFSFDLTLESSGGKCVPATIDEVVRPLGDIIFFGTDSGLAAGLRLFGIFWEEGKPTTFQIVGRSLDEFATLASRGELPKRSGTISRSSFGGNDLYNLDLGVDPGYLPTEELLGTFRSLSAKTDTRELSIQKAPGGTTMVRTLLSATSAGFASLTADVQKDRRWEPTLIDATPETSDRWSFSLFLQVAPADREPSGFPLDDLRRLFALSWPQSVRSSLKISWTPARLTFTTEVPENEAKALLTRSSRPGATPLSAERPLEQNASLAEMATSVGMSFFGSHTIPDGSADESIQGGRRVQVTFFKKNGLAASSMTDSGLQSEEKALFPVGVLMERTPLGEATRYLVRIPVTSLSQLISGLSPNDKRTMTGFSLRCVPPADPEAVITITRRSFPGAGRFFQTVQELTGTRFPWNVTEDGLAKSLSLHELDVSSEGKIVIRGLTAKSGRIFSELFPALQRIPGISEPFFSEGNYRDSPFGRLMKFTVTATGAGLENTP
ncbi:MAG: hypothetical protein WA705_28405 [Candidatus Ozemobacteraceae bacterium]